MKKVKKAVVTLISLVLIINQLEAQTNESYISEITNSEIKVNGNSTLHEWEMKAKEYKAIIDIQVNNNQVQKINAAGIKLKAESILSDNSIMDEKCHEALKSEKNPEISFTLTENLSLKVNGENFSGTARGNLKIAGQTKVVDIPYSGTYVNDMITLKGGKKLKMTDFGMTPPSAMLGSIKTDNEVLVSFQIQLKKKTNNL